MSNSQILLDQAHNARELQEQQLLDRARQAPELRKQALLEMKLSLFSEFNYTPHDLQYRAHEACCDNKFVVVAAGARGGKSLLAAAELFWHFMQPKKNIWCVSSQYQLAEKPIAWLMNFAGEYRLGGTRLSNILRIKTGQGKIEIYAPWGSFIKTKSTEKPDGLLGEELDLLVIDEASTIKREPWDRMLSMRLVSRKGKMLAISTPNGDSGLFKEFFLNGQSRKDGNWWSISFSTHQNPYIDSHELKLAQARMSEENYREQVLGEFVSRRGRVFQVAEANYYDTDEVQLTHLPCVFSLKPQYHNPYVILVIYYDYELDMYYCDEEHYELHSNNAAIADKVRDMQSGKHCQAVVIDDLARYEKDELPRNGVEVQTVSEQDVSKVQAEVKRIQLVQNLLKEKEGKARLRINRRCANLLIDLNQCSWQDSRAEKDRLEPEMPLDKYMSGIRALAYGCGFIERTLGVNIYA